jgi:hypothetical protein
MGFLGGLAKSLGGMAGAVGGGKSAGAAGGGMMGGIKSKLSAPKPPMPGPAMSPKSRGPIRGGGMANIRTMGKR